MSLHKLTAGDGYTYLIRQVAASDSTERGAASLGEYYSAKGESPGVWRGRGLESLGVSGEVSEAQMRALFGEGMHPNADAIIADAIDHGVPAAEAEKAAKLGRKFYLYEGTNVWREGLGEAYAAFNTVRGWPENAPIEDADRVRIRTDVAGRLFRQEYQRAPASTQEFTSYVARLSRPMSTAVAGYDLTFSPVKSVSTLWAISDRPTAELIRHAHEAAVTHTLEWIESELAFTRVGSNGVAQVRTRGLVIAQFTHRDARSGEPDLHTHAAVSNKVQTLDGRWLALDGRTFHKYAVAASERYNNHIELQLVGQLGVRFEAVERSDGKRQVREIVAVPATLRERWSSRRISIEARTGVLARQFVTDHGRVPTSVEAINLAQQATLETRQAKHEPRSEAAQRQAWRVEAVAILGPRGVTRVLTDVRQARPYTELNPPTLDRLRARTAGQITDERGTWQHAHVLAEAQRQVRHADLDPRTFDQVADLIVQRVLAESEPIRSPIEDVAEQVPAELMRDATSSVYSQKGAQLYTSAAVRAAEQRIVDAGGRVDGRTVTGLDIELAVLQWEAEHPGRELNEGQRLLVQQMATSGRRLQLAIAPAGTGKTTAMGVLAAAWSNSGGHVLGLAPQAGQAEELAAALGDAFADTLDKLVYEVANTPSRYWPEWLTAIGPNSLVIIDESGRAGTPKIDAAVQFILSRGGSVRLVGDEAQYAATGAGGVLRDIDATHGSLTLNEIVRFDDPAEAHASLGLRAGDPTAIGYYLDRGRIHIATPETALDEVYKRWKAATDSGKAAIMSVDRLDDVTLLNARARADRLADTPRTGRELSIGDRGERVSAGDVIITKKNNRRLSLGGTDYVKNGHRWTVQKVHRNGQLTVRHTIRGKVTTLPADYVQASVRLGYADTKASVQGRTVGARDRVRGVSITLVDPATEDRNAFYTTMTRATSENHAVLLGPASEEHSVIRPEAIRPPSAAETLQAILQRDGAARSASTEIREAGDPQRQLGRLADMYLHSIQTGALAVLGSEQLDQLTHAAEAAVPGVSEAEAWETLRAHLALLQLDGHDAIDLLTQAAGARTLDGASDLAAVLDWRLDPSGNHSQGHGPLPWLPAIPYALTASPRWSEHLHATHTLLADLVDQHSRHVELWTPTTAPAWAQPYLDDHNLLAELSQWRAATSVPDTDLRPAGPRPHTLARQALHRELTARAVSHAGHQVDGMTRWSEHIAALGYQVGTDTDPQWPLIAARLTLADTAGMPVDRLLREALAEGPLPAEFPSAALWHRLARHLSDVVAAQPAGSLTVRPAWTGQLATTLGTPIADRITADRLWPVVVARIDTAQRAGADPATLITHAATAMSSQLQLLRPDQLATVLLWHVALLTEEEPLTAEDVTLPDPDADDQLPPAGDDPFPPDDTDLATVDAGPHDIPPPDEQPDSDPGELPPEDIDLVLDELRREDPTPTYADPPSAGGWPTSEPDIGWRPAHTLRPDSGGRTVLAPDPVLIEQLQALAAAHEFYQSRAADSWVPGYLAGRGLGGLQAGYAPAGWTNLVDHLRGLGITDKAMIDAGLAKISSRDSLIDTFRDRLMLPIYNPAGHMVTFSGRAHPDRVNDRNPRYINGPTTALYRKGELPHGLDPNTITALQAGADLAIVEGPLDAAAINHTAATHGLNLVAVYSGGTALTAAQLDTLNTISPLTARHVIAGYDNDPAGQAAALKMHRLLDTHYPTAHSRLLDLPTGADPAQLLDTHGSDHLAELLTSTRPLLDLAVDATIAPYLDAAAQRPDEASILRAAAVTPAVQTALFRADGTSRPDTDNAMSQLQRIATVTGADPTTVYMTAHRLLNPDTHENNHAVPHDPALFEPEPDTDTAAATPATPSADATPTEAWAPLVDTVAPYLATDKDWPQLAAAFDRATVAGYDVPSQLQRLVHAEPDQPPPTAATVYDRLVDEEPAALPDVTHHPRSTHMTAAEEAPAPPAPPAQPSTAGSETTADTALQAPDPDQWRPLIARINPSITNGPDWNDLRAALARAQQAGYNIETELPRLARTEPLPEQRPGRELLYRLVDDCEDALPPAIPNTDDIEQRTAATREQLRNDPDYHPGVNPQVQDPPSPQR
ncbi:MAG: MobF family relaxase [Jatrophihabitantaceae bacterium]